MANFKGKGSMSNRNVIITFPEKGRRVDEKTGNVLGYYADVELNQTDYDKGGNAPQTNPHLVTYPVKGKNGKSFPNHRFYYPVSQVKKMMAPAGDNMVYTTKDPNKSGKDAYTEYDKMEEKPSNFKDNFDSTRIAVNASLMTTMTKYGPRVIINTSKPIQASTVPFHKGDMAKQAESMHVAKENEQSMSKQAEKTQDKTLDPVMGNIPGLNDKSNKTTAAKSDPVKTAEEAVKDGRAVVKNNPAPVAPNPDRVEKQGHSEIQNLAGPDPDDDTNTAMDLSDGDMPF